MPDIVAIARGHTALKFSLTGIRVEEPHDDAETEALVGRWLERTSAVLIIEGSLYTGLGEAMAERLDNHEGLPLVVTCPTFEAEDTDAGERLRSLLRSAVGYDLRLV